MNKYICSKDLLQSRGIYVQTKLEVISNELTNIEKFFNHKISAIKSRAKSKSLEFNITYKNLIDLYEKQNKVCYYSGLAFNELSVGPIQYNTISVDRINSKLGYTVDNIALCLFCINAMKSDYNMQDLNTVFKAIHMKTKSNIKSKFRKLYPDSIAPSQSDSLAAGYDLSVYRTEETDSYIKVFTGVAVQPDLGHYFMLVPRSSTHKKGLTLYNNIGIIDVNYTGEIIAVFKKTEEYILNTIKVGDRLVQLVPQEQHWVTFQEVTELDESVRGDGGFGSTGK